jgi:hypothetical protein
MGRVKKGDKASPFFVSCTTMHWRERRFGGAVLIANARR